MNLEEVKSKVLSGMEKGREIHDGYFSFARENAHLLTKDQLATLLAELDYQMKEHLSAREYNEIVEKSFEEIEEEYFNN